MDKEVINLDVDLSECWSRKEALKLAFPDRANVYIEMTGGYQGDLYIAIELDGNWYLSNDYYGSCSGCDAYLANSEKWLRDITTKLKKFPDKDEAIEFLREDTEEFGLDWSVANTEAIIGMIEDH